MFRLIILFQNINCCPEHCEEYSSRLWPQLKFLTVVGDCFWNSKLIIKSTHSTVVRNMKCFNAAHENFLVHGDTGKNCTHSLSLVFLHRQIFQRRMQLVLWIYDLFSYGGLVLLSQTIWLCSTKNVYFTLKNKLFQDVTPQKKLTARISKR